MRYRRNYTFELNWNRCKLTRWRHCVNFTLKCCKLLEKSLGRYPLVLYRYPISPDEHPFQWTKHMVATLQNRFFLQSSHIRNAVSILFSYRWFSQQMKKFRICAKLFAWCCRLTQISFPVFHELWFWSEGELFYALMIFSHNTLYVPSTVTSWVCW